MYYITKTIKIKLLYQHIYHVIYSIPGHIPNEFHRSEIDAILQILLRRTMIVRSIA